MRPTKKQKELLNFIDGFIKGYGYGPSYREIMRALDYKSVSTVATHVTGLISRGWLVKKDNSARSLTVVMSQLEPKTDVVKSATINVSAEQLIKDKIADLQTNPDENAQAIDVLRATLVILGYADATDTEVV